MMRKVPMSIENSFSLSSVCPCLTRRLPGYKKRGEYDINLILLNYQNDFISLAGFYLMLVWV